MPATVVLNSNSALPSDDADCSTVTPPGPDARPSNVKSAEEAVTSLPNRSFILSANTPGSPARHPSNPERSNVVAETTASPASTSNANSRDCEPLSSTIVHVPARVGTTVTSYVPLPRSVTTQASPNPPEAPGG